jgi:hypothetical protein
LAAETPWHWRWSASELLAMGRRESFRLAGGLA